MVPSFISPQPHSSMEDSEEVILNLSTKSKAKPGFDLVGCNIEMKVFSKSYRVRTKRARLLTSEWFASKWDIDGEWRGCDDVELTFPTVRTLDGFVYG